MREQYSWAFFDALTLARNIRDQATIYYCKDGVRASYDVVTEINVDYINTGTMVINGWCLTADDFPPTFEDPYGMRGTGSIVCVNDARLAKVVFEHNGIDTTTGWDLRP